MPHLWQQILTICKLTVSVHSLCRAVRSGLWSADQQRWNGCPPSVLLHQLFCFYESPCYSFEGKATLLQHSICKEVVTAHVNDNCGTCQLHNIQVKGGRQRKGKHLGRPPQTGPIPQPLGTSALVHFHLPWASNISHAESMETFWISQYNSAATILSVVIAWCSKCILGTADVASQAANAPSQWGVYKSHQSSSWSL